MNEFVTHQKTSVTPLPSVSHVYKVHAVNVVKGQGHHGCFMCSLLAAVCGGDHIQVPTIVLLKTVVILTISG